MTPITAIVLTFLIMSAVFLAPHINNVSGHLAAFSCLVFAALFFVIQLIFER